VKQNQIVNLAMPLLLVAIAAEGYALVESRQKIAELAAEVDLNAQQDAARAAKQREQTQTKISKLQQRVALQREQLDSIEAELKQRIQKSEAVEAAVAKKLEVLSKKAGAAASVAGEAKSMDAAIDAAVAGKVEQAVEAKMKKELKKRRRRGGEEWKPSIGELEKELEMDAFQVQKSTEMFNRGKDLAFELFKTPREDGTSLLDDLAVAMRGEDPEKNAGRVFMRIFTERVPGTEQTYLQEIMKIRGGVVEDLGTVLDEGQIEGLHSEQVNILEVDTGYDPFGEYIGAPKK
jgi:hypothetical protein